MAQRVLPQVRMLFPCDSAHTEEQKWVVKNPRAQVLLPAGAAFPIRILDLWIYAQFTDGLGDWDLAIEMRQVLDHESYRSIGASKPLRMTFPGGSQLWAFDTVFHLTNVPFQQAGLYEFRVTAGGQVLEGQTALLRVLDRRATV